MRRQITDVQLQQLTAADVEAYRRLRLFMLEESPTAFGSDLKDAVQRPLSHFRERIAGAPDNFVIGAFSGDVLVASAGGVRERDAKRAHIATVWGMFVHPDHRGMGLGGRLLGAVLERLDALVDLEYVQLAVTAGNHPAQKLYESAGFQVYGREPAALKVAGVNHDELLMSRLVPALP